MRKLLLILCLVVAFASIPAFAETKTLNFLEVLTSPERTVLLKGMIAEYEASHPGIKINLISPPYEQADQKATLMLNSNQPLDVIEVRDYTMKQFVNNKKLLNLTKYYRKWKEAKTLTSLSIAAAKTVDKTLYIVPQGFFIKALFVRQDVLAKNGITTIPTTLEDLVKTCIKITDPAKNQYGFAWRGKGTAEIKFADLFAASCVKDNKKSPYIYSEDGAYFTNPQFAQGMKSYIELYRKGSPQDSVNWGFNEQINGFVSGITPFLIQDPDAIPLIDKLLSPDKYVVVPVPLGPHGYTYLDYGFNGLGIPSYSKNQAEAWDFVQWMSSADKNGYFCENYGTVPVHTTTYKTNKTFQGPHYAAFSKEMTTPSKFIFKNYPLASPKWPGWGPIHEADMQSVLLGQTNLDTLLAKWQDYWKK